MIQNYTIIVNGARQVKHRKLSSNLVFQAELEKLEPRFSFLDYFYKYVPVLTIHFCSTSLSIENHQLKDRRGNSCLAGGFQEYLIKINSNFLFSLETQSERYQVTEPNIFLPWVSPDQPCCFSSRSSCSSVQVKLQVKIEDSFCWGQSYWLIFFDVPNLFLISSLKDTTLSTW